MLYIKGWKNFLQKIFKNVFFCFQKTFFALPKNPFPFFLAIQTLNLMISMIRWIHFGGWFRLVCFNLIIASFCAGLWWSKFSTNYVGGIYHNLLEEFIRFGFVLFILSEIMFFFGFFWRFFHSCWTPTFYIGAVWPPFEFISIIEDAFSLSKTVILLSSAATVTVAHKALLKESYFFVDKYLVLTCILGLIFLFLQRKEYVSSIFSINSMVFSTTFFLLTGFHGLHVTIGFIFLVITFFRLTQHYFSSQYHQGFTFAIWYWHFVDVVWLGLYGCVYHYRHLLYNI